MGLKRTAALLVCANLVVWGSVFVCAGVGDPGTGSWESGVVSAPSPSPSPVVASVPVAQAPPSKPAPSRTQAPPVSYHDCDEVRAAGKAPLYRDQPGYRPGLDGDHDGVACE